MQGPASSPRGDSAASPALLHALDRQWQGVAETHPGHVYNADVDVVVVGGSLGGLAAGLALAHACPSLTIKARSCNAWCCSALRLAWLLVGLCRLGSAHGQWNGLLGKHSPLGPSSPHPHAPVTLQSPHPPAISMARHLPAPPGAGVTARTGARRPPWWRCAAGA